jgi:hypothetical protein
MNECLYLKKKKNRHVILARRWQYGTVQASVVFIPVDRPPTTPNTFAFVYTPSRKSCRTGTARVLSALAYWFRFFFFWQRGFGLRSSCTTRRAGHLALPARAWYCSFQARSVVPPVTRCLPEKSPAAHSFLFFQLASCLQFYVHVFAGRGLVYLSAPARYVIATADGTLSQAPISHSPTS